MLNYQRVPRFYRGVCTRHAEKYPPMTTKVTRNCPAQVGAAAEVAVGIAGIAPKS